MMMGMTAPPEFFPRGSEKVVFLRQKKPLFLARSSQRRLPSFFSKLCYAEKVVQSWKLGREISKEISEFSRVRVESEREKNRKNGNAVRRRSAVCCDVCLLPRAKASSWRRLALLRRMR